MRDSLRARNIFVMLTNRCNLRCGYCYEAGKNMLSATSSLIHKYVGKELSSGEFDEYFIVFHGGEPFLEYSLMKEISEWCWTEFPSMDIRCMATTNGTCLDADMKQWLTDNRERFVAILSLDGGRDTHNQNRCGSFDLIDKEFFARTWPHQPVKMTISPNSVHNLYADFLEIIDYGLLPNPSLAKEVEWDLDIHLPIFVEQASLIVDYYLEHRQIMPCELINVRPSLFKQNPPLPRYRACGAGVNNVAYDIKGKPYPCHTFITDLGKEAPDNSALFEQLATNDGLAISPGCANCIVYPACEPCYGLNYSKRGDMGAFDAVMCEFTKARVKLSAKFYAEMITSGKEYIALRGMSENELYDTIAGIMFLENHLK